MTRSATELLLQDRVLRQLFRFVAAAADGIEERYLTAGERERAGTLEAKGLIVRENGRLRVRDRSLADTIVLEPRVDDSDIGAGTAGEVLSFVQELQGAAGAQDSVSEVFQGSARKLFEKVPFDVAVIVTFGDALEMYALRREGAPGPESAPLLDRLTAALERNAGFRMEENPVRTAGDWADLAGRSMGAGALSFEVAMLLTQGSRTVGLLAVYRSDGAFISNEQKTIGIVASHVGIGIANVRARQRIQKLADTDELTGIANRRAFRRRLLTEFERARLYDVPLSIMMIDVDDFKAINDGHGHSVGDVLLSELCGTINDSLRQIDVAARFGGDEFAVLLPHTPLGGAISVAERIVERANEIAIAADDQTEVRCSVSVGVVSFEKSDLDSEALIRRADAKLYDAKRAGKNRYTS